jgi:hypothetical protein
MLMAVALGLMAGAALGDEVQRRKNAEEKIDDLRQQLSTPLSLDRQLKEIRSVLNDAHKKITAVTKALAKPAR